MLRVRDFSDVEALYHDTGCRCSENCRRFSAEEKAMATHTDRLEELMKMVVELEQIAAGEEDGSISTQRANNLRGGPSIGTRGRGVALSPPPIHITRP